MSHEPYDPSLPGQSPDPVRDEAADWIVRLEEAAPEQREALLAQCEAWQARDPRHRRVFAQMQQMWDSVNPQRKRRRDGLLGVLLLVVFGTVQLPWEVDYYTSIGEIRLSRSVFFVDHCPIVSLLCHY